MTWGRLESTWADLGLNTKGLIVIALPLAILLGGIGALHFSARAEAEAEQAVRRTFAIQRDIHEVHALLAEAASGVRGYRLTGRQAFLEPYRRAEAQLPLTLQRLNRTVRDPEIRRRLGRIDELVVQKRQGLAQLAAMEGAGLRSGLTDPEVGEALVSNKAVLDALRAEIDAMQRREALLLDTRRARADAERQRTLMLTAAMAVVGLLGSLAAVQLLFTGVVRRVRTLERNAERLERGEPLTVHDAAQDEIGRLARRLVQAGDLLRAREQALREGEERYRSVIEGVRDYGIFALDIEGRVVSWNEGAQRIKGWTSDEILGQHFSVFYPADVRRQTPSRLLDEARLERRVEDEGWRVRRDGSRFWANVVITAVVDEAGTLRGFSKVTRDVTERRRAQEALETARAEAESASRAKSEFLSRMSHELRTPLTAVLGFNQLLHMDRETLTPDQVHAVDQIDQAGRHLLGLIDEVLDIARIEAGGQALTLETVDLRALISDAIGLTEPQAQASDITVRVEAGATVNVHVDRRAVLQILLNLLSNAAKYGGHGGTVSITMHQDGDRIAVDVQDEGPGIAPEVEHRLFTPFDRLDAEQWSGAPGSGLGLALSRRLARSLGGELAHRNVAGVPGAIFRLELPLAVQADRATPASAETGPRP